MDFNPACAANLTTRMVDHGTFEALHVQLLAISANNRYSQQMFAASLHLPFPLISDHPDLMVIQHYGVLKHLGEAHQPVARGAVFLVDKRGVIRGHGCLWAGGREGVSSGCPSLGHCVGGTGGPHHGARAEPAVAGPTASGRWHPGAALLRPQYSWPHPPGGHRAADPD